VKVQVPFKVMRAVVGRIVSAFKITRGNNAANISYFTISSLKADPGASTLDGNKGFQ
jgi:hypothetical protein